MMRAIATIFVVFAVLAPTHAAADCNAQISKAGPIPAVAYDPFDGNSESETFAVEFTNNGPDACTLGIAVASLTPGSARYFKNGANQLRYVVEWPNGDDLPNNIALPQRSIALAAGAGQKKTITLRVKVPSGLIAPAGTYTDTLKFRAYRAGTSIQVGADRDAPGSGVVESRAQVNIAGASSSSFGSFGVDEIDFDTLATGETRSAFVQVRATKPVSISVSSQRGGVLRHEVLASDPGVPYSMTLAGDAVTWSGSPFTLIRNPPLSLSGASYPMVLTIASTSGRPAGNYQDMLTITVSPQ